MIPPPGSGGTMDPPGPEHSAEYVALPAVFEDDSGEVWYAPGHIDPRHFVLAIVVELIDMRNVEGLAVKAMVEATRHEWFKPTADEEMWNVCHQDDEGAEAWTTVRL